MTEEKTGGCAETPDDGDAWLRVTDQGFLACDQDILGQELDAVLEASAAGRSTRVLLPGDMDSERLDPLLAQVGTVTVRIDGFADGRGFSLIRELRLRGFTGTLRAAGNILPDQYAMLRRLGADEVLISERWAARHRQEYWLARADWRRHHYQVRLESQGVVERHEGL